MKARFVFAVVLALYQTSAWAAPRSWGVTYQVGWDYFVSPQLQSDCDSAWKVARPLVEKAEANLGLEKGTLSVNAGIISVPMGPGYPSPYPYPNPGQPQMRYECLLGFHSKDKNIRLTVDTTPLRTHLKKEEQATACKPEFDEVASRPGILFQEYEMGATLFQGRLCDVGFVEATRRQ